MLSSARGLSALLLLLAMVLTQVAGQIVTPHTPTNEAWRAGQRITVTWDVDASGAPTVEPMDYVDVYIMRCDNPACLNAIEVAKIGTSIDVQRKSLTATLPSSNLPPQPDYFVMITGPTKREVKFSSKIPLGMTAEQGKSMLAAQSSSAAAAASSSAEAARAKATPTATQPPEVVTVTVTEPAGTATKTLGTAAAAAATASGKPNAAETRGRGMWGVLAAVVVGGVALAL